LKRDSRFKYVSIFKNQGSSADKNSSIPLRNDGTTFVPGGSVRASRPHAIITTTKNVRFCDILAQEERQGVRILEICGDMPPSVPTLPAFHTDLDPAAQP